MPARTRDLICLAACATLGIVVEAIHLTSWSHSTQRPLKIAVIVFGLAAVGGWRAWQIRRARYKRPFSDFSRD